MTASLEEIYKYFRKNRGQEFDSLQLSKVFNIAQTNMCYKLSKMRKDKHKFGKLTFERKIKNNTGENFNVYLAYRYER